MTSKEKYEFLDSIRFDRAFRDEVIDIIFNVDFLKDDVADILADKYYYDFNEKISDAAKTVKDKVERQANRELEKSIKLSATAIVTEHRDVLLTEIAAKVAAMYLTEDEKEKLKSDVAKEMMKQRSYREDLLDLEDYDE